jgi:hypothetical protein
LPDFSICSTTSFFCSSLAANRSPTSSLASLGNSLRLIFLIGSCTAPNASLALSTPSRLSPFSSPVRIFSRAGNIVPEPWMYSTVFFSSELPPTTDSSTRTVTRRPVSIFTPPKYTRVIRDSNAPGM